ncbi:acyl-CoA dehydrogenase [Mucilaginibacter sp. 14171R-50]|uniref:acyl-CoA dehydrogenase n=1 Tax=Mucilaginibacter sp. 14171R-50 TaxID=2703789 RepID=UPI00138BA083|nr:acyl-CoA dehydrogenase [Mucilaginibacter sp. 14171R-50]QHS54906.1 acyl-CoA dehydrogenase [Mucilaginibacter sp. 14171R-50]
MEKIQHPSYLLTPEWIDTIRNNAQEAERMGKLHPAQLQLVYEQQWFNLLAPHRYGGAETPLPQLVKTEEALAWADGSLGWVVTLCCGAGWFGGFMNPAIARQIYSDKHVCLAGSGAATGTATITGDGYIINGGWKYASGVHHATYITVNCNILNDGSPVLNKDGTPLILPFVLDRKDVMLQPGWKYMGMIATGSDAYMVNDLRVDKARCFKIDPEATVIDAPLYTYPFLQLAEATLAANLSGMAIHFMDLCASAFESRIINIRRIKPENVEVMNEMMRYAIGLHDQSRATFFSAVENSWSDPKNEDKLMAVSSTSRVLAKISRECVDELYPYCGLQAASADSEINRAWRDLHTASQHSLLTFLN